MNPNRELLAAILALITVAFSFWGGVYVLRPMDVAAKAKKSPVQFTILDFLSLTAYFAVPLALMAGISKTVPHAQAAAVIISVGGCFLAWLIWWGGVSRASKAGIRHAGKRLLMIGLVVPLTYAVTLIGGGVVAALISTHFASGKAAPPSFYFVVALWASYFFLARRIVLWILSADAPKAEAGDPWSESERTPS